jgi:hypothetical protein
MVRLRLDATGVRDVKLIKQSYPLARVMVLAERCDLNEVLAVFRAGADGYVLKTITPEVLMKSLELLMLGETVLPSSILLTALTNGVGEISPPSEVVAAHAPVAVEPASLPNAVQEAEISEARDAVSAHQLNLPERALPLTLTVDGAYATVNRLSIGKAVVSASTGRPSSEVVAIVNHVPVDTVAGDGVPAVRIRGGLPNSARRRDRGCLRC